MNCAPSIVYRPRAHRDAVDFKKQRRPAWEAVRRRNSVFLAMLSYALRRWAVFPCVRGGKKPLTKNGFKDATDDPVAVRFFWPRCSKGANVAIATGSASGGLLVVDVDPRNGGGRTLVDLELQHGRLARDYTVETSSGGMHLYFRLPPDTVLSCGQLGQGIDIKCEGGYVIAPPSLHPSGHVYRLASAGEVPTAPEWLIASIKQKSGAQAHTQGNTYVNLDGLPISEDIKRLIREGDTENKYGGDRSKALFAAERAMVKSGIDDVVMIDVLMNRDHALSELPLENGRAWLEGDIKRARDKVDTGDGGARDQSCKGAAQRDPLADIESAADLVRREFPEPKWVVPGLIPSGLTLFAGKSKAGKSWFALQTATDTARQQGDVLYLALEDTKSRLQQRILMQCESVEAVPSRLGVVGQSGWTRLDLGGLNKLREWLVTHPGAVLIIIDTLAKVKPPSKRNGNAYEDDYAALTGLKKLADEFDLAIIVVHHLRKMPDPDDPFNEISGTTGLTGCADTIMVLQRPRQGNIADLHVTGRDVEAQQRSMTWDPGAARWTMASPSGASQADQDDTHEGRKAIFALLRERGPMTMVEIVAAFGGRPEGTVKSWLSRMVRDGKLINEGGKYSLPPDPSKNSRPAS